MLKEIEMKRAMNVKIDSTLERQISAARMSPAEREVAVSALRTAAVMVDAAEWFVKKIEQFGNRGVLKPSLRT